MNMTDVGKLVDRWLDERVEIDGTVNVRASKGNDAFEAIIAAIAKPDSESVHAPDSVADSLLLRDHRRP